MTQQNQLETRASANRASPMRGPLVPLAMLVSATAMIALGAWVTVEEVRIQRKMAPLIKDMPLSIVQDRATETLIELQSILGAHSFAPSLANVRAHVDALARAELERIEVAARRRRFDEALDRIHILSSLLGDRQMASELKPLRVRCVLGRDCIKRFRGHLVTSAPDEASNPDAFRFYDADVPGIVELFDLLDPDAQRLARQRIAMLASIHALPMFTEMYLLGGVEAAEKYGPDKAKPLLIVVREMAEKAKVQQRGFVAKSPELAATSPAARAWNLIVDGYFKRGSKFEGVDATQLRQRAIHMVSFYLDHMPKAWPTEPERLRKLFLR